MYQSKISSYGNFILKNFKFELNYKIHDKNYLTITKLNLDLGESKLFLNKTTTFLSFIVFMVNHCKPFVNFGINKLVPFIANLILKFKALPLDISITKNYNLDLSLNQQVGTVNENTVIYSLFEFHNSKKRSNVPKPEPLEYLPVSSKNSFELAINDYFLSSALTNLADNNDLKYRLTDEIVFNATKFIHLNAMAFINYIPGLEKHGQEKLLLDVLFYKNASMVFEADNTVKINANTNLEFLFEKNKKHIINFVATTIFAFSPKIEDKAVSLKLKEITITDLSAGKNDIGEQPKTETIKNDFNGLFKVLISVIDNYFLNIKYDIEKILNDLKLGTFTINELSLVSKNKIICLEGLIDVKE